MSKAAARVDEWWVTKACMVKLDGRDRLGQIVAAQKRSESCKWEQCSPRLQKARGCGVSKFTESPALSKGR